MAMIVTRAMPIFWFFRKIAKGDDMSLSSKNRCSITRVFEVDKAKSVIVFKRGKGRGFSGLENPLFFKPVTGMLYGDAKESLTRLIQAVQHA